MGPMLCAVDPTTSDNYFQNKSDQNSTTTWIYKFQPQHGFYKYSENQPQHGFTNVLKFNCNRFTNLPRFNHSMDSQIYQN